jgi:outer membrane lipoprotein-sorting protein
LLSFFRAGGTEFEIIEGVFMKRLVPFGLAVAVLLTALAVGSPNDAHGQSAGLVSSVLSKMERNRQSLKSLRSGISMEKYNPQIGLAEKFNGIVLYMPGAGRSASVRIEWSSPQHEILAVSNGEYVLFRPRLRTAYKGRTGKRKEASDILELMNMSRTQLQMRFEPFQDVREESLYGVSTIHLKLVPKGAASFKYAEIWVDSSGMPVQSKVVEKNDDATTIRLSAIERNPKISAPDFNIKLDPDVKIIRG